MRYISILFWFCLSITLALSTGFVVHKLYAYESPATRPQPTNIPLTVVQSTTQPRIAGNAQVAIDAASALIWDTENHMVRYSHNAFDKRPIASITKLMTAMVALDHGIDLSKPAGINLDEYGPGGNLLLHPGEFVTMQDLMYASLIGSANNATKAYVRELGITPDAFVQEMNRKAITLGLEQTHFTDVTGLDPTNVSTAYDVAILAEHAFKNYPLITTATRLPTYTIRVGSTGREHVMRNTNKLIQDQREESLGSKTGYLDEALYCLVMQGGPSTNSRLAVILGSPSEDRNFLDMQHLLHLAW